MAGCRRAVDLAMTGEEIKTLTALSRSRTEAARHVERAQMLLAYRQQRSFFAVGQRLGVHHQTVQRCVERALAYGALAALDGCWKLPVRSSEKAILRLDCRSCLKRSASLVK